MLPLLLDEDSMERAIVRALHKAGIDVVTIADVGRRGFADEQQLEFAVREHRTLVSRNVEDFARIHTAWMHAGKHHAGIVAVRVRSVSLGAQIKGLTRLAKEMPAKDMVDRFEYLNHWL